MATRKGCPVCGFGDPDDTDPGFAPGCPKCATPNEVRDRTDRIDRSMYADDPKYDPDPEWTRWANRDPGWEKLFPTTGVEATRLAEWMAEVVYDRRSH